VSEHSAISWTGATWNPVTGCTKVSPGCANCYIERTPPFRMAGRRFVRGAIPVLLHRERLDQPLRWRKPRRVFVCSLADLFHDDVPDEFIGLVFAVMAAAEHHTFQVLTKRPDRMRRLLADASWHGEYVSKARCLPGTFEHVAEWPLSNVWCGVSVENQRMADERIPVLLDTPAAVRFLSCEPLLSALDLGLAKALPICREADEVTMFTSGTPDYIPFKRPGRGWYRFDAATKPWVDWVIVGGESGPGSAERKLVERCTWHRPADSGKHYGHVPCDCNGTGWRPKPQALEWVRSLRDQCVAASVPFFFKQWAGPRPASAGALIDGREWRQMP